MEDPVFSSLEEEVVYLRAQLAKERAARFKLDEELDLLAFDNDRLRGLVRAIPKAPAVAKTIETPGSIAVISPVSASNNPDVWPEELLVEGDGKYADAVVTRIDNACGGMNALCVAFCPYPSVTDASPLVANREASWAVACGGVDKTFRVYHVPLLIAGNATTSNTAAASNSDNTLVLSHPLSAPILAMDVCGSLVACALMDGGHAVVSGGQ